MIVVAGLWAAYWQICRQGKPSVDNARGANQAAGKSEVDGARVLYHTYWLGFDISQLQTALESKTELDVARNAASQIVTHLSELSIPINLYRGEQKYTQYISESPRQRAQQILTALRNTKSDEFPTAAPQLLAHLVELRQRVGAYFEEQ